MLERVNLQMLSSLPEMNPENMIPEINEFYEAPCKKRCGELIPSRWDVSTNQWVYERECFTCDGAETAKRRYANALVNSGLTNGEAKLTLNSFHVDADNAEAYDAAVRLSKGEGINLYLHGSAGRGKTHLGVGIVLEQMLTSRARFFPISRGLMLIRSNIRETSEDTYLERLLLCDSLVMDDFGANKLTEWNLSFMDCFIDEWYRHRKSGLVITSNFSLKEIAEKISDRIASRLAQMCEIHELGGRDRRI